MYTISLRESKETKSKTGFIDSIMYIDDTCMSKSRALMTRKGEDLRVVKGVLEFELVLTD